MKDSLNDTPSVTTYDARKRSDEVKIVNTRLTENKNGRKRLTIVKNSDWSLLAKMKTSGDTSQPNTVNEAECQVALPGMGQARGGERALRRLE